MSAPRSRILTASIGAVAAAGLVLATLGLGAGTTTAAYTDATAAETSQSQSPLTAQSARMIPTQTRIANTITWLQSDGTLWVWGFRGNGLSGSGSATVPNNNTAPSAVILPNDGYAGPGRRSIVKVAGTSLDGYYPTDVNTTGLAALSDDGQVYTWGGNSANNIMGRPSTPTPYTLPGLVSIPGRVVDLASSATVYMALTDTGDVYTWGYAQARGVTGQGTATASSATPSLIMSGVHSIGAGLWNGWAIRGDSSPGDTTTGVFWWGWANTGSAYASDPSGDNIGTNANSPTRSTALSAYATSGCDTVGVIMGSADDECSIKQLNGHYFGNQLVTSDGQLIAWGAGSQYGTGRPYVSGAESATPTVVPLPNGDTVASVSVTVDYVEVLAASGTLYIYGRYSFAWGPNPATGAVSATNIVTPTAITAFSGPVAAVGGFGYSGTALLADGTLASWGGSTQGGNSNLYNSIRPDWYTTQPTNNAVQGILPMTPPGL
ncbi:hypothetical protein [Leifsonia sp. NCR5]|uniref:hypothetical protein n=1 Tax=Leifsonia sp. NCR5 TaxID=1978342 RepID=UPI000A1957C0|nr:hypothetical protein [Leifsonia sp. NCR5]